jgi:deazaflavin-dependent oxidoreductase (nitroreductase family)
LAFDEAAADEAVDETGHATRGHVEEAGEVLHAGAVRAVDLQPAHKVVLEQRATAGSVELGSERGTYAAVQVVEVAPQRQELPIGGHDSRLSPQRLTTQYLTNQASMTQSLRMTFEKTPSGTRGRRTGGGAGRFSSWVGRRMIRQHRRNGDRFMGMDVAYLTTVGARSGSRRETAVSWFSDVDEDQAWLVVASFAGAAQHPGWYHNMAAHPDRVWIEVEGHQHRVVPEQLSGPRRDEAWQRIVATQPRYARYQAKTDRELPVVRLVPARDAPT